MDGGGEKRYIGVELAIHPKGSLFDAYAMLGVNSTPGRGALAGYILVRYGAMAELKDGKWSCVSLVREAYPQDTRTLTIEEKRGVWNQELAPLNFSIQQTGHGIDVWKSAGHAWSGAYLSRYLTLSPDHPDNSSDVRLLNMELRAYSDSGDQTLGFCMEWAFLPTGDPADVVLYHYGAEAGTGELEGYVLQELYVTLQEKPVGTWACIQVSSGGPHPLDSGEWVPAETA